MAPGVSGVEFEAHGRIAPANLKEGSYCGECDRKPVKNRTSGDKTAPRTEISPVRRFKSDRLLGTVLIRNETRNQHGEIVQEFTGKLIVYRRPMTE